eukprot:11178000-Lingulodinium_polyedra.AAC.1
MIPWIDCISTWRDVIPWFPLGSRRSMSSLTSFGFRLRGFVPAAKQSFRRGETYIFTLGSFN